MVRAIDHVIIAVRDLSAAMESYRQAGFTVTPGGEHADGATHNALVTFGDGAYFELIAFREPDRKQDHKWWGKLATGEGTVDYALLADDLDAEADRLRQAEVIVDGPRQGGRNRPDGQAIAWKTISLEAEDVPLPFVLEDVTDHDLRVPPGEAARHALNVQALAGLTILVPDLDRATPVYEALLGASGAATSPNIEGVHSGCRFPLGTQWIELAEPDAAAEDMQCHIRDRGAAPYEIVLVATAPGMAPLPPELTHAARIRFEPLPAAT